MQETGQEEKQDSEGGETTTVTRTQQEQWVQEHFGRIANAQNLGELTTNLNDVKEAEEIQTAMVQEIQRLHELSSGISDNLITADPNKPGLINQGMMIIDSLYRRIPNGYHLDVGLTPDGYYSLEGPKQSWLRQEQASEGIRYLARVGRVTNPNELSANQTVLNLGINLKDDPHEVSRFSFMEVSKHNVTQGNTVRPKDILNLQVKQNPPTKTPNASK